MATIQDLISAAGQKNPTAFKTAFNELASSRIHDRIDAMRPTVVS